MKHLYLTRLSSTKGCRCILDACVKLSRLKMKGEVTVVRFSSSGSDSPNENAHKRSSTNEIKVLHCLNTLTAEQMSSSIVLNSVSFFGPILAFISAFTYYRCPSSPFRQDKHISYILSEVICKYREANGLFSTLKDLRKVKQIGPYNFKTICEKFSIEGDDRTDDFVADEDSIQKYASPELTASFVKSVSTVTSLEVCVDSVCFCTMSRDMEVIDWNHVNLKGSNHRKVTPSQILDQAVNVLHHLPKSSIVLMENRLARKITPSYLHYLLFIGRLQMALQTLINEDLITGGQHRVFQIKDLFAINMFQLRVGGERVSGQNIMQQIQNEQFPHKFAIDPKFWQRYNRMESDIFKERYSNCLLMSLAFCQDVFVNRSLGDIDNSPQ